MHDGCTLLETMIAVFVTAMLLAEAALAGMRAPLTAPQSRDDTVRARDGTFVGLAADY